MARKKQNGNGSAIVPYPCNYDALSVLIRREGLLGSKEEAKALPRNMALADYLRNEYLRRAVAYLAMADSALYECSRPANEQTATLFVDPAVYAIWSVDARIPRLTNPNDRRNNGLYVRIDSLAVELLTARGASPDLSEPSKGVTSQEMTTTIDYLLDKRVIVRNGSIGYALNKEKIAELLLGGVMVKIK